MSCPLDEILLLTLIAVLAGAETFAAIALFGVKKLLFSRRFRPFLKGTPAHDHLSDILAALDAEAFPRCFTAWAAALAVPLRRKPLQYNLTRSEIVAVAAVECADEAHSSYPSAVSRLASGFMQHDAVLVSASLSALEAALHGSSDNLPRSGAPAALDER